MNFFAGLINSGDCFKKHDQHDMAEMCKTHNNQWIKKHQQIQYSENVFYLNVVRITGSKYMHLSQHEFTYKVFQ